MYYSAGTYESFAHPEKPKDADKKSNMSWSKFLEV